MEDDAKVKAGVVTMALCPGFTFETAVGVRSEIGVEGAYIA